jgi:hypothetical protein
MTTDHPPNHPGQLVTIVRADRQSTFVEADSDDDDDAVALALGWTCLDCGAPLPEGRNYYCEHCDDQAHD